MSVDVTHGSFVAGDGLFIDSIAVGGPEETAIESVKRFEKHDLRETSEPPLAVGEAFLMSISIKVVKQKVPWHFIGPFRQFLLCRTRSERLLGRSRSRSIVQRSKQHQALRARVWST